MQEIVAVRLRPPVLICFHDPESRNLNNLVLIPYCLTREVRRRIAKRSSATGTPAVCTSRVWRSFGKWREPAPAKSL